MMKPLLILTMTLILVPGLAIAQKGIDKQTKKIKGGDKTGTTANEGARTYSWGGGKTKIRKRLPNPYKLNGRRDILINIVIGILKDRKMIVDEAASRFKDGLIITQPFTFSKGAILTKTEINRYAVLPSSDAIWTRGRYTLTIDIASLDGIKNNVAVTAKVEGRSGNGLFTEWSTLQSSGVAEDEFLAALVENVSGDLSEDERKP